MDKAVVVANLFNDDFRKTLTALAYLIAYLMSCADAERRHDSKLIFLCSSGAASLIHLGGVSWVISI